MASIVICFSASAVGGLATGPQIQTWFATVTKPSWNPPNWVFGPVWTVLFLMMAISAWLVWKKVGLRDGKVALIMFAVQLILNVGWSILFFGMQNIQGALIEIGALWLAIAATIFLFSRHSKAAAWLLVPYIAWVSFASFLNYTIWTLN